MNDTCPEQPTFANAVQQYFARRNEAEAARLIEENRKLRQKLMIEQRAMAKAA